MKIRIKGNSVRIRLSKSELDKFAANGYLEETTAFVSSTLTYALEKRADIYGNTLTADMQNNTITMFIPQSLLTEWTQTDRVGFEANMMLDNGEVLYLLLEKDFKCLDETIEDQSDNFDNPNFNMN